MPGAMLSRVAVIPQNVFHVERLLKVRHASMKAMVQAIEAAKNSKADAQAPAKEECMPRPPMGVQANQNVRATRARSLFSSGVP
jgi:hypothetical protein